MILETWWDGAARRRIPESVRLAALHLQRLGRDAIKVREFDRRSRLKLALLYGCSSASFGAFYFSGDNEALGLLLVLVMGLFSIPYTRVFMHSQMHWGMESGPLGRFLLDHFVSLQFSIPQTGYAHGHRLHHRYDNDFSPTGFPRDLQSTYMFSRDGAPTHPLIWLPFYMFYFQTFVGAWLVLRSGRLRDILSYLLELVAIVGLHAGLFLLDRHFYFGVYLPALLIAWCASGIVLYVMHAVDARHYSLHPTNNSHSRFFNRFGDNDGFHLEHTLFPGVHPIYLERLHGQLTSAPEQNLKDHYVIAFFRKAFAQRPPLDGAPAPAPESH